MTYTDILIIALGVAAVIILGVCLLMLKVTRIYIQEAVNPVPFMSAEERHARQLKAAEIAAQQPVKPSLFNRLMGLKPIEAEKDLMMEHQFDGITELNNPTPGWFMVLFYGSIIFAIGYMFHYEVFGGPTQEQEYVTEMQQAEDAKLAYLASPNAKSAVNENNIEQSGEPAVLKAGAALYTSRCTPCHGEHGEGGVGPNLTDEYWLHGGTVGEIFKTIKYGVPAKGMVAWEKSLSAQQLSDLTNYVMSLQGTKPAGAKEPQGEKL